MTSSPPPAAPSASGQRLARAIARAGLCSRREAERWIIAARVAVNNEVIVSPATTVAPTDRIAVDGAPLPALEPPRLWLYHKPRGLLTSTRDDQGRPLIFDHLPSDLPRVIAVGRLDFNSEGLLLLSNDGALARQLELPANGWRRRYRARVHGRVEERDLPALKAGITVDGQHYGPIEAVLERRQGANAWLSVTLSEGRNREVRRIMEHLGWPVNRLIRVSFGPFTLKDLPQGSVAEVATVQVRALLGLTAHKAGWARPALRRKRPRTQRRDKPCSV